MDLANSLLTNKQREYLAEGKDGAAGRMARKRIKERVREGLHDFRPLVAAFHEEGLGDAFKYQDEEKRDDTTHLLPWVIAFLYLGVTDTVELNHVAKDDFEDIVGDGVKQALNQTDAVVASVDVDIDITHGDREKAIGEMTMNELQEFAQRGEIDREEFIEEQAIRLYHSENPERAAEALADALGIGE